MPEVAFTLQWPDGAEQACLSPSTVIEAHLTAGAAYPRDELLRRAAAGMEAASERVRTRYGHPCSVAAATRAAIEAVGARQPDGHVRVLDLHRPSRRPRPPRALSGRVEVAIVGGGQAGMTLSRHLVERAVDHVVLERATFAHRWHDERWDAFCLVTPNWQCRLPGGNDYDGDDPDGFMVREDIVAYLERFRSSFDAPLVEGVEVTEVGAHPDGGFRVATSAGELAADQVVLAVGGYHAPRVPALAARLDAEVTQLHTSAYRNPSALPDGGVLVVGTGQSGAQIAEDLHLAGRQVHIAVGSAPRVARRYRGRDCVAWLEDLGHYDMPVGEHRQGEQAARHEPNHYVTGRDGGHDLDLRAFAAEGVVLHGRLVEAHGPRLTFRDGLAAHLDGADATMERIKDTIDAHIDARGIDAPAEARYAPVWSPGEDDGSGELDLEAESITTVIWATGFVTDWSWVRLPAFDGTGYPVHVRGVTSVEGLHVLGMPWLHTWGSGRFAGIDRDAAFLADRVEALRATSALAA